MTIYVPGTEEKDPKKIIMSLQQIGPRLITAETDIATKTTGPNSATDNALPRFDGTTGKIVQNSEITLGDSDGKLTRSAGISISGTNTTDDAAAGYVGEYVSASLAYASRITFTSGVSANITSISLGAGDWDVTGFVNFEGTTSPATAYTRCDLSTVSATGSSSEGYYAYGPGITTTVVDVTGNVPLARFSLGSTTTIYLVGTTGISAGTIKGWGFLRARRVR